MTNTNSTAVTTATKYLRKYGPSGTYTSTNAPYGTPATIVNSNPFLAVYGNSAEMQTAYATALESYKPRTRKNRAGETFRY